MAKKRKISPRKRPATQADVNKAKKQAIDAAIDVSWAISLTVLRDKWGFGRIRLHRYWDQITRLSEEMAEGRVSVTDLMDTLREEAGIIIEEAKPCE